MGTVCRINVIGRCLNEFLKRKITEIMCRVGRSYVNRVLSVIRRHDAQNLCDFNRLTRIKYLQAVRHRRMRRFLCLNRVLRFCLLRGGSVRLRRNIRNLRRILQGVAFFRRRKVRPIIRVILRRDVKARLKRCHTDCLLIVKRCLLRHVTTRIVTHLRVRMLARQGSTRIVKLNGTIRLKILLLGTRRQNTYGRRLRLQGTIVTLTRLVTPIKSLRCLVSGRRFASATSGLLNRYHRALTLGVGIIRIRVRAETIAPRPFLYMLCRRNYLARPANALSTGRAVIPIGLVRRLTTRQDFDVHRRVFIGLMRDLRGCQPVLCFTAGLLLCLLFYGPGFTFFSVFLRWSISELF